MCPGPEEWLEALDGGARSPAGAHDGPCETCQARSAEARKLLSTLSDSAPRVVPRDEVFVSRVEAAVRRRTRQRILVLGAPFAAAACLLLWLRGADEPLARGTGGGTDEVCAVHAVENGTLVTLRDGDRLPVGTPLAFSVSNPEHGARWLGIFGIGPDGAVGWYEPAWESPAERPHLLRLPARTKERLLGEHVSLPFGPGRVRVVCWRAPADEPVADADTRVQESVRHARAGRVAGLEGVQESMEIWFEPPR